jgi:putative N6-adenine-specific DNA methylase
MEVAAPNGMLVRMPEQFFSVCPCGLEQALADELVELGGEQVTTGDAGVSLRAEWPTAYRMNLMSRIASRVLWQVSKAEYRSEDDIYQTAAKLPWPTWFEVKRTITVSVNARKCPLRSLDFVTLRIKDAVCDQFRACGGDRPNVDTRAPDMRIFAFLDQSTVTFYLDTSGEALFKRGRPPSASEAPLKENLAAGILRLSDWQPGIPLLDPMCGSGTFLLEAAQMALNIAPGLGRRFAFEKLSGFQSAAWQEIKNEAEAQRQVPRRLPLFGSDLYRDALKVARINAAALGLGEAIEFKQVNVLEIKPPAEAGIWITNPPYGVRIGEQEELAKLYPQFGHVLKRKFAGWTAYFFTADLRLAKLIRLQASKRVPLFNGPLECRLFEYRMVAGSARRD